MDVRRIEFQAGRAVRAGEAGRRARRELGVTEPRAREADAAEVVDAFDLRTEQAGRRRDGLNEFRTDADLDLCASRQLVVAAVERDHMTADLGLTAPHLGRQDVHAGRADEIADERVRRLVEQLGRRAALHHAAVMHDYHGVGEGQRLGLVVGDVDHRQVELAMQRLQLGAELPFQLGVDHGERLVEQHGGNVGAYQAAAERDLLLGIGREPRRLAVQIGLEVEQAADLGDPLVDLSLRHAAVLQRERQILPHRHGVVDHRKLEHLGDVALLG